MYKIRTVSIDTASYLPTNNILIYIKTSVKAHIYMRFLLSLYLTIQDDFELLSRFPLPSF